MMNDFMNYEDKLSPEEMENYYKELANEIHDGVYDD